MVTPLCIHVSVLKNFEVMRGKKSHEYSLYKLCQDSGVSVTLDRGEEGVQDTNRKIFQRFVDELPLDECRYAVYDFKYTTKEDGKCNKLAFIIWCPEEAGLKQKENYAHFKSDLRQKLQGIGQEFYIDHPDDLDYDIIRESLGI